MGPEVEAVFAEGITAAAFRQFGTRTAEPIPFGKGLQLESEPFPQPIRLEGTVFGNLIPDIVEILP